MYPLNLWGQMPALKQKRLVAYLSRLVQGSLGERKEGSEDESDRERDAAGL
jgi:hypothetical protein